ncbi:hypothetical protein BS17DRAFT_769166 [Gyrodon lividus]|nr:hypothetical protein BS17DRAFT_769166 [Gyrodon lividus]
MDLPWVVTLSLKKKSENKSEEIEKQQRGDPEKKFTIRRRDTHLGILDQHSNTEINDGQTTAIHRNKNVLWFNVQVDDARVNNQWFSFTAQQYHLPSSQEVHWVVMVWGCKAGAERMHVVHVVGKLEM